MTTVKYIEKDAFMEFFYIKNYYIGDTYRSELLIFEINLN